MYDIKLIAGYSDQNDLWSTERMIWMATSNAIEVLERLGRILSEYVQEGRLVE